MPVFQQATLDPGVKQEKLGDEGACASSAVCARIVWSVGRGVSLSPSPLGEGLGRGLRQKCFSIFELKMTSFGAFWVPFLQWNGNRLGH